jgi:hypothetical protein
LRPAMAARIGADAKRQAHLVKTKRAAFSGRHVTGILSGRR